MSGRRIIQSVVWQGQICDCILEGDRIAELRPAEGDGSGGELLLLPGLIDCHTHLREPGQEHKEDIASGLAAAASGGFCSIFCMANTVPVNDNSAVTSMMLDTAARAHPRGPALHPVGALSRGLAGKELAPMHELARSGCIAFSNDGIPVSDSSLMRRAMEYSTDLQRPVIDHCEDSSLSPEGMISEGPVSDRLGLRGVPSICESIQVARDILLASYLDIPVHLAHISRRESVELIHWAKNKGVPVSAETCPHYLLWTEDRAVEYDPLAKVNPPLGTADDVTALRQAVREGVIDILATDHAPHAPFEKEVPLSRAPNGISGLDTALSLCWTLVQEGVLTQKDLVRLWCHAPARIFGLRANGFNPGDPADFLLFDPRDSWTPTAESMRSRGKNTPCLNQELPGRIRLNCRRGEVLYGQFPEGAA
ncbi:MAG: dihydroorotase [Desulfohalobiaceae bacterium]|nr:dihydroorotase [Desulfohalobiaceae bacterium]